MSSVIARVGQAIAWFVILLVLTVLVVAVLIPRIAGATPYAVLTGSMRPSYPPGTLIVAKPIDPEQIRIGDVVTIQLESGKARYVTHRVTSVSTNRRGELSFTTRGDANDTPDADRRRPEQVRGKLWYSVPHLGRINGLLTGQQRQWAVYGVAGGLLLYAGYMFTSSIRDRRSRPSADDDRHEEVST
ncbi:MAG TPA: signal peptidase I [Aeromicrobium sp.]|nr:signal peptidase I [Aeromicrobium sp.]